MDAIFYHPATQAALNLLLVLGLLALILLLLGALRGWRKRAAQIVAGLMLASIPASMLIEELLPLIGRAPPRRVAEVAAGMLGFLLALALLLAGAARLVRATLDRLSMPPGSVSVAGWGRVWAPGGRLMLAAAVLFALSAALYHENRFPFTALFD